MAILVSTQVTGTLGVTGQVTVGGITGSLFGTASYATPPTTVPTASYALTASMMGASPYTTIATSSAQGITCSFTDQNEYVNLTTGNVTYTFTSSNPPSAGNLSDLSLFVNNTFTGVTASLSFPAQWVNMNGGWPTSITASKNAVIYLRAYGPSQIIGTYLIQP